jgi:hypothetical protein
MASVTGTTRSSESSMPTSIPNPAQESAQRSVGGTLKSYFFWTHQRGSFHYDVMVTLILAFIFISPWIFNFGDKAPRNQHDAGAISVIGDGEFGMIITVPAQNVKVDLNAGERTVRHALHDALQPVTGDDVSIDRWQTVSGPDGQPAAWKVWAHR